MKLLLQVSMRKAKRRRTVDKQVTKSVRVSDMSYLSITFYLLTIYYNNTNYKNMLDILILITPYSP